MPHGSVDDMGKYFCMSKYIPPHQHDLSKKIPFNLDGRY